MRQVGGNDQYGCCPVSRFRVLRFRYRGRGHHGVHRLRGRHFRSTNQVACPLPYYFADRLHGHPGQHAVQPGITAASTKNLGENRGGGQHAVPVVVGHLQPHIHRTIGGRLRHSFVVEHHRASSTDPGPPSPAHACGHSDRAAATSSSLTCPCTCSSSATKSPRRSCSSWRSSACVT